MLGVFAPKFKARAIGTVPVGALVYWAKSFTGVRSLINQGIDWFQECNGQTCTDGRSALSGQTLPPINTQSRFLRGQATSGGTGGTDSTHIHGLSSFNVTASQTAGGSVVGASTVSPSTDAQDGRPAFYNAVCLICIL